MWNDRSQDWLHPTRVPDKVEEIEAGAERRRGTGTSVGSGKPPKFDGTTSGAVFRRRFEIVAEHNCWTRQENSTYSITVFQDRIGPTTCYAESRNEWPVRPWRTASGTTTWLPRIAVSWNRGPRMLENPCKIYHSCRTVGPPRLPALPEDHIRRDAGKAFADLVEDPAIEIQLLPEWENGERGSQEGPRTAGRAPSSQAPKTSARTFRGSLLPPTWRRDQRQSACWSCGEPGHFRDNCHAGRDTKNDDRCGKLDTRYPRETYGNRQEGPNGDRKTTELGRRGGQPSGNERVPEEKGGRRRTY
jgi:hypothetical protein